MVFKAIIFDFDGVIVESMDIKTRAFVYLFKDYPEDIIKRVVQLHLDNGGMSRFEKFRIIYRIFLNKELSKGEEKRLSEKFSDFCYIEIIKCPYVAGAKEFLENNYQDYMFFIVSGTPHDEINHIVKERGLQKYFKGVYGTPMTKGELIKRIMHKYNLKINEAIFIGDSPTDYIGAKAAGIKFIARIALAEYNPFIPNEFKIKYSINDLFSLEQILKRMKQ